MAIDLNALRAKHAELSKSTQGGGGGSSDYLQIKEGTTLVRILPAKDEETEFYAETKLHRIVGSDGMAKNYHCRKMHGEACPLCDTYFGLWKTDKDSDKDLARQIKPRARYYMNILDRDSGEVKILSVGVILFKKIVAAMLDEDFGDITDLQDGFDFKIIKTMEGQWPKYDQSQPRPKSEPTGSQAEIAAYMDSLHDVHKLVKLEDYDEVKTAAMNVVAENSEGDLLNRLQS
tara:strand:+ start:1276 stop:1971 length:696 start_codon:yes stop_codon:yes gene_type:complete